MHQRLVIGKFRFTFFGVHQAPTSDKHCRCLSGGSIGGYSYLVCESGAEHGCKQSMNPPYFNDR